MSNRRRQIDVNNIFIEVYRAFPANIMGRDEIDPTNNVILPPSALKKLSYMKNFWRHKKSYFIPYSKYST